MVGAVGFVGLGAGAVEAVGADAAFGEADAGDEVFDFAELEGCQAQATGYLADHAFVFGGTGGSVAVEVCGVVSFEVADNLAADQLHVAFGGGEADEGASVHKGRT